MQATDYQRKYTKRKILLLLVLLVVGMFILLLVKPKRHSQAESPVSAPGDAGNSGAARPANANKAGWMMDGAPFTFKSRFSRKARNR